MTKGRHGLTNEQIYALAEAQGFICPLSKIALEVREREIYDPTTGKRIAIDHDPPDRSSPSASGRRHRSCP